MTESTNVAETLEYSPDLDTYRAKFSIGELPASAAIVEAIAEIQDCNQDELEPLYSVCDSNALDTLIRTAVAGYQREDVEVSFQYQGYAIEVRSYGIIRLKEVTEDA